MICLTTTWRRVALVLALLVTLPALAGADSPLSAAHQTAQMKRGVNILSDDPLWQDASQGRFKPHHFKIIRDGGFDTVRINLYGFRHMDEKMELAPTWFATLDRLIGEAVKQNLNVILDEHDYETCHEDEVRCMQLVLAFWSQVADHYQRAPNNVIFEILNQPNGAMDGRWNELHARALAHIRKSNPTRNVIIGPAFWNNISWLPKLELPAKDRHIIVSVHYYEPQTFTLQGASWTPEWEKLSGITWGTAADFEKIDRDFDSAQAWAKKHDRPILLGEFGAYDKAPQDSRTRYTAAVARAAEKRGWAWTYWQFDGNFFVYDIDADKWNEPIRNALIPQIH
jgi:endoglucanase